MSNLVGVLIAVAILAHAVSTYLSRPQAVGDRPGLSAAAEPAGRYLLSAVPFRFDHKDRDDVWFARLDTRTGDFSYASTHDDRWVAAGERKRRAP